VAAGTPEAAPAAAILGAEAAGREVEEAGRAAEAAIREVEAGWDAEAWAAEEDNPPAAEAP
jgi:hypothetical protein